MAPEKRAATFPAENWGRVIPHEGTSNVAWGLIAFDSLASYETHRARLKADLEGRENFSMA